MLCAPLHSSLQRPVSHPGVLAPLCPPHGCKQRCGVQTAGPAQGTGADAVLWITATLVVILRCLLAALSPKEMS